MATPPTFVSLTLTPNEAGGNGSSSKTISGVTVQVGDRVVVWLEVENASTSLVQTTSVTMTGSGATFTKVADLGNDIGETKLVVWTGTVAAAGSFNVVVSRGASNTAYWGGGVYVYRGSDGFGNVASTPSISSNSGAPSIDIDCSDNSAIVMQVGDWDASDGSSRVWRTINGSTGTEDQYRRNASFGAYYANHWGDVGATGTKTAGLTTPAMTYAACVVEILGTAGAPATNADAGFAAATAVANNATVVTTVSPNAGIAEATAVANDATVTTAVNPPAGYAEAVATAHDATVVVEGLPAPTSAEVTATAYDAVVSTVLDTHPATAEATATAYDATVSGDSSVSPGLATATAEAYQPTVDLASNANPGLAQATATAYDATVTGVVNAPAVVAAATATAYDPTLTLASNATPGVGEATATAYDATVDIGAGDPYLHIFTTQLPASPDGYDGNNITLATKFRTTVDGRCAGVRWFAPTGALGVTPIGLLYDNLGNELARKTFGAIELGDWNQLEFDTPVVLTPGTFYKVAVWTDRFASTAGYFATGDGSTAPGITNGPLNAPDAGTSPNGQYDFPDASGPAYPNTFFNGGLYFVDVLFDPTPFTFANAGLAEATATAYDPAPNGVFVYPTCAEAVATAGFDPGTNVSLTMVSDAPIEVAATAYDATVAHGGSATPGVAEATATAYDATVMTTGNIPAGIGEAVATAYDAVANHVDSIGHAAVIATGYNATPGVGGAPATAEAIATAYDATVETGGYKGGQFLPFFLGQ